MSGKRILVVDDEAITLMILETCLDDWGYEVIGVAMSADQAISMAIEQRPNLILMDITLKGDKDGIEATHTIKAIFEVPVIFVTAHVDHKTIARAEGTPPPSYILNKPFRDADLKQMVEMALVQ
ncbi:MAG: response regulator [Magnetococcales bacterium]|nr:response regulator [Magnetococcales bacterium]